MSVIADVIVVGGGGSGLATAISARESGASVVLLEKNPELGGTTRFSIGSITASGTPQQRRAGIADTADAHFEDMPLFAPHRAPRDNAALRRILVDNVADTLAWLTALGLTFHGPSEEPPHRVARMHVVLPNSRAFIHVLGRHARRIGVDVRTSVNVVDLLFEDGQVVGVKAVDDGRPVELRARRGVVLTTGDYSGGEAMKARLAPSVAGVPAINPTNTGDGQAMVERAGGSVLNGDFVSGPTLRFAGRSSRHWLEAIPPSRFVTRTMAWALRTLPAAILRPFVLSYVTTFLAPEVNMFRKGVLLVTPQGEAIEVDRHGPGAALAARAEPVGYMVLDAALVDTFSRWPDFVSTAPNIAYAYMNDYRRMRPDLYHEAPDLESLATRIGADAPTLAAAVERHGKERAGAAWRGQGPYVALGPVKAWTILTDGGVAVDTEHRVLRADGSVIGGLYAAGSAGQGGLLLDGHGHHLGWAFTSGRRAGRHAAANPAAKGG